MRKQSRRIGRPLLLAAVLALVAGCATGGRDVPERAGKEASAAGAPLSAEGPSVARLADGREGFVIREAPRMDAEALDAFALAVALLEAGEDEKALALLEKVVAGAPGVTAPYINLALARERLGRPAAAEESLQSALELFPGHPAASNAYGLLLRRSGRFAEARAIYEGALAAFPEYLPVRRNLGILCDLYLNDLECALEQYTRYSAALPDDAQVRLWVDDLSLRLGR